MPEEFLPKPQTDLPLPEKELPEHASEPAVVRNETPSQLQNNKLPVKKIIILGVIAVILLAAIGGAYVLSQNKSNQTVTTNITSTPSPTLMQTSNNEGEYSENPSIVIPSGWLLKTSSDNKFSFQYPPGWSAKEENPVGDTPYIFSLLKTGTSPLDSIVIFVHSKSIDELVASNKSLEASDFHTEFVNTNLNGSRAVQATVTQKTNNPTTNQLEEVKSYYILFPYNGLTYQVLGDLKDKSTIEQIASSFRFN